MKIKNDLIAAAQGFGMGAANIVPGVSGGTIALITGIYGTLIGSLNAIISPSTWTLIFKEGFPSFWEKINGRFLLALAIGTLASIFLIAKIMDFVIVHYPIQTWAFFFGLIVSSATYMIFDATPLKIMDVLWIILGAVFGVLLCLLSPAQTTNDIWFIFICGVLAICTMILPGISGSFVLVILGKYEYMMEALGEMNIPVLAVFVLGCLVGVLAFAKFLHWLLGKCERQTMLVLIGFVIGSLLKVWPWNDMQAIAVAEFLGQGLDHEAALDAVQAMADNGLHMNINTHVVGATLWAVGGMALVWCIENLSNKINK